MESVKVNTQAYIKIIDRESITLDHWKCWVQLRLHLRRCSVPHIHDPAVVKYHLNEFWDKNMWPPSSPSINPIDFAICSIFGSDVSVKSCSSVAALKNAASWSALDEEVVRRSCHSVPVVKSLWSRQKEVILQSYCCNILAA